MKRLILSLFAACSAAMVGFAKTITVTSTADTFPDAAEGSLRAALAAAEDGDTITFADSLKGQTITIVGVNTAKADTTLVIDKTLTIDGNGVIIDGGWNGVARSDAGGRIFRVASGLGKITFKDITLQNGHGRGWNCAESQYFDGGAVYALSPVRFENCSLIRNCSADETAFAPSGTGARGGGAISAAADVEVVSCFFGTNSIPTGSSSYGGAIRITGGSLSVEDTVFDHDYTSTYGGGVAYIGSAVTGATFKNCKFIENSSVVANGVAGGAIFAEMADNAALKFFDCVFRGGSGANQGGAVYCTHNVALVAVNCEFADSYSPFGGAVYSNVTKPLLFVNCTFLGNAANTWGGAFEITDKDLCLVNCTIAGSYCAGNQGGGLYASRGLHLLNTVFGYNYWGSSMDFNDGNQNENTCLRSLYKGKSTAPFGTTYTLATSLDEVPSATKLFANYQMVSDMHGAGATGARVQLPKSVVMPTFAEDRKSVYPSRVIGIEKDSVLNGTGYPVRANADYSYVDYSDDDGATWKQFFKLEDGVDTANMTPITADQRGVGYYKGKTPIGAATYVSDAVGLVFIVR